MYISKPHKLFQIFGFVSEVVCKVHFYRLHNSEYGIIVTAGGGVLFCIELAPPLSLSLSLSVCPTLNFQNIVVPTLRLLSYASASVD
jgi:hypothetical protein